MADPRPADPVAGPVPRVVGVLVAGALGVSLWLLRSRTFHPDGLDYAQAVKLGHGMFHPHHLAYSPAAWLIHRATGLDPIASCQLLQVLSAVVLLGAAWRLAHRLLGSSARAWAAAALLLATRGVLAYATWLEVYVPALALAVLAADEILRPDGRVVPAALYLTGSVLFHQMGVLLAVPALVVRPGGRRTVGICGLAGALTAAAYVAAARAAHLPLLDFVFLYARAGVPPWGAAANLGPHGWRALGANLLDVVGPVPRPLETAGAVVSWLALLAGAAWAIRRRRDLAVETRFAAWWLAAHLLFVLWWLPTEMDLFVAVLAPLWLLGVQAWAAGPRRLGPRAVAVAAALTAAANLTTTVLPRRSADDVARAEADRLDRAAPPPAVIVTEFGVQQNLIYFHDRVETLEWAGAAREMMLPDLDRPVVLPVALPDPRCDARTAADWVRWRAAVADGRPAPHALPATPAYAELDPGAGPRP